MGRMKRWIEEHPERVKELHKEQARKYRENLANDPELKQLHLEKAKIARLKHKNKTMLHADNIKNNSKIKLSNDFISQCVFYLAI
jgi:ABC-type taurine transport system substrate-binding protein